MFVFCVKSLISHNLTSPNTKWRVLKSIKLLIIVSIINGNVNVVGWSNYFHIERRLKASMTIGLLLSFRSFYIILILFRLEFSISDQRRRLLTILVSFDESILFGRFNDWEMHRILNYNIIYDLCVSSNIYRTCLWSPKIFNASSLFFFFQSEIVYRRIFVVFSSSLKKS